MLVIARGATVPTVATLKAVADSPKDKWDDLLADEQKFEPCTGSTAVDVLRGTFRSLVGLLHQVDGIKKWPVAKSFFARALGYDSDDWLDRQFEQSIADVATGTTILLVQTRLLVFDLLWQVTEDDSFWAGDCGDCQGGPKSKCRLLEQMFTDAQTKSLVFANRTDRDDRETKRYCELKFEKLIGKEKVQVTFNDAYTSSVMHALVTAVSRVGDGKHLYILSGFYEKFLLEKCNGVYPKKCKAQSDLNEDGVCDKVDRSTLQEPLLQSTANRCPRHFESQPFGLRTYETKPSLWRWFGGSVRFYDRDISKRGLDPKRYLLESDAPLKSSTTSNSSKNPKTLEMPLPDDFEREFDESETVDCIETEAEELTSSQLGAAQKKNLEEIAAACESLKGKQKQAVDAFLQVSKTTCDSGGELGFPDYDKMAEEAGQNVTEFRGNLKAAVDSLRKAGNVCASDLLWAYSQGGEEILDRKALSDWVEKSLLAEPGKAALAEYLKTLRLLHFSQVAQEPLPVSFEGTYASIAVMNRDKAEQLLNLRHIGRTRGGGKLMPSRHHDVLASLTELVFSAALPAKSITAVNALVKSDIADRLLKGSPQTLKTLAASLEQTEDEFVGHVTGYAAAALEAGKKWAPLGKEVARIFSYY